MEGMRELLFTIVATGAMFPRPEERTAYTAVEAEALHLSLSRLCGKSGKVQVFAERGREIHRDTLQRLAVAERENKARSPAGQSTT